MFWYVFPLLGLGRLASVGEIAVIALRGQKKKEREIGPVMFVLTCPEGSPVNAILGQDPSVCSLLTSDAG